jgi:putative hydrolase of the HAD superfamily
MSNNTKITALFLDIGGVLLTNGWDRNMRQIKMFRAISKNNQLKIGAISNEGRELTTYRVNYFGLTEFIQFFICSCFVHFRKPDKDIYLIALDVGQAKAEQSLYIDDRQLHVEVAAGLGMNVIHHTGIEKTRREILEYGLKI